MHLIHRGIVNKNYKENLLNSFRASFKKGYGIETDIHATKDGHFVCFHDFTLKNSKINKSIKYKLFWFINLTKKNQIPLLKDLLKLSKNKFKLFIEIKPLMTNKLLRKLLSETKKYKKCVFISFKEKNIYRILKLDRKIKVGLSYSQSTSIKKILKKSKNKEVNFLILDKYFLKNTEINKIKKDKYFIQLKIKRILRNIQILT